MNCQRSPSSSEPGIKSRSPDAQPVTPTSVPGCRSMRQELSVLPQLCGCVSRYHSRPELPVHNLTLLGGGERKEQRERLRWRQPASATRLGGWFWSQALPPGFAPVAQTPSQLGCSEPCLACQFPGLSL